MIEKSSRRRDSWRLARLPWSYSTSTPGRAESALARVEYRAHRFRCWCPQDAEQAPRSALTNSVRSPGQNHWEGRPHPQTGFVKARTAQANQIRGLPGEKISNSSRPHNHPADGVKRMRSPSKLIAHRSEAAPPRRP
jgi:hypothetical protein